MLKPNDKPYTMARRRYTCCHLDCSTIKLIFYFYLTFTGSLTVLPRASLQFIDHSLTVKPTPALRLGKEELMTVVLLKNDNSRTVSEQGRGRFINVRPEIGLLTSTARTFIQEGITTEYATQVVGTTLDSGRLYAQFLKKSSRVLYKGDSENEPAVVTSWVGESLTQSESVLNTLSKNLLQSHNDVFNAEKPDWRAIDDDIFLNLRDFVVNTDFVQVRSTHISPDKDFQPSWTSTPPTDLSASLFSIPTNVTQNASFIDKKAPRTAAEKVLQIADLPTYTVKNHYEPSGYFRNDSFLSANRDAKNKLHDRSGKLIYKQFLGVNEKAPSHVPSTVQSNEAADNHFSTITYYGFADFTTLVGDSVIVFSPGTAKSSHNTNANVTSIKGEATLDVTSFQLTHIEPTETDIDLHNFVTRNFQSKILSLNSIFNPQFFSEMSLTTTSEDQKPLTKVISESSDHPLTQMLMRNSTLFSMSTLATAPIEEYPRLSRPSNEEILKIFAALASAEANTLMPTPVPKVFFTKNNISTNANMKTNVHTLGGATTVFFEDDPFTNFLQKSNVEQVTVPLTTKPLEEKQTFDPDFANPLISKSTEIFTTENSKAITITSEAKPKTTDSSIIPDVIIREINSNDKVDSEDCIRTSQVFLTQLPRTVTELITSTRIDNLNAEISEEVDTQVIKTFEIGSATKYYCIQTSPKYDKKQEKNSSESPALSSLISTETPNETTENIAEFLDIAENEESSTFTSDIAETTTESKNEEILDVDLGGLSSLFKSLKESGSQPEESIDPLDMERGAELKSNFKGNILDTDEEDEVELIYKTLYTTYTYLTTYFHDVDTSISSHTEVVTNIITSTLDDNGSSHIIFPLTQLMENFKKSHVTSTLFRPLSTVTRYTLPTELDTYIQSEERKDEENEEYLVKKADERNENNTSVNERNNLFRTFYTTYTYYTTIFADDKTEIMSRIEIHTNFATPTKALKTSETETSLFSTLSTESNEESNILDRHVNSTNNVKSREMHVSILPDIEDSSAVTLITDVRSSSSMGDQHVIDRELYLKLSDLSEPNQTPLDDQISSESNTDDEVLPSATLLLQTSFTTFTYYTTMYSGKKTNIISRLETITNIHTETLESSKTLSLDEATLPITYFTTFTYWTKLARDGQITTVSREETISNVVTPTKVFTEKPGESKILSSLFSDHNTEASTDYLNQTQLKLNFNSTSDNYLETDGEFSIVTSVLNPTTYYTTYTFYTTSYESDNTITDSHLETITNKITPTLTLTSTAFVPQTTTSLLLSVPPETISDQNSVSILAYDLKKIIDADGISTLIFTTQIQPTVDQYGKYSEFVNSTSTLYVDEVKKAQFLASTSTEGSGNDSQRQHKTGLVRLIEGTRTSNKTTTLYQSRVIGTIIDQRYAQIIESTSSFIFEQTSDLPSVFIQASNTLTNKEVQSTRPATIGTLNSSLIESSEEQYRFDYKLNESDLKDLDRNSPYATQSKKRVFTPTIRPFASRNRPQFAPKKNSLFPSSATIITRSDFTPTITATPALKSSSRFTSLRHSSNPTSLISGYGSARRFGRLGKPSSSIGSQSNRINSANSQQSFRINVSSNLRRLSGSINRPTLSSIFSSSDNRLPRVKPTKNQAQNLDDASAYVHRAATDSTSQQNEEDNFSQHEENDVSGRLSLLGRQNKLRTRRPSSNGSSASSPRSTYSNINQGFLRRLSHLRSSAATTTVSTPTTSRPRPKSFQRPAVLSNAQNRSRFSNNLFPPRNIFGTQKAFVDQANSDDNNENTSLFDENVNKGIENDEDSYYEEEDDDEILEEDDIEDTFRRRRSKRKSRTGFPTNNEKFQPHGRIKREADNNLQNLHNFRNRFRRPMKTPAVQYEPRSNEDENTDNNDAVSVARTNTYSRKRVGTRLNSRLQNPQSTSTKAENLTLSRPIRPTRPIAVARAQFTLREKDSITTTPSMQKSRTGFRRNHSGSAVSAYRPPISSASNTTGGNRRLKSNADSSSHTRNSISTRARSGNLANGRARSTPSRNSLSNRARTNNDIKSELLIFDNSGTITVTYTVPASVTIPVVDGKVTEYKLLVTAKTYSEVLGPEQYTSFTNVNGQTQLVLTREDSTVNYAGETRLTQYLLHETPTTTITFTPTTIRGRKTSFSHILPSTVYSVEELVSTIQPKISPNAPLANILLSQLLLGQVGLPAANPLFGALGGALTQPVGLTTGNIMPVTEYRTHASTYVTTLYEGKSTVLPVTFQGKKILTTVYDTTAQTITATEFVTDTIITTPTLMPQVLSQTQPVANTLLLQQLLLQQQLQQQQLQQQQQSTVNNQLGAALLNIIPSQLNLNGDNLQQLEALNNIRPSNRGRDLSDDEDITSGSGVDIDDIALVAQTHSYKANRKKSRKSGKSHKRKSQVEPAQPQSSIITLYLSGRRPGEFSTVLSTVPIRSESTLHKRHATAIIDNIFERDSSENLNDYVATQIIFPNKNKFVQATQALESIVGDVVKWHTQSVANRLQDAVEIFSLEGGKIFDKLGLSTNLTNQSPLLFAWSTHLNTRRAKVLQFGVQTKTAILLLENLLCDIPNDLVSLTLWKSPVVQQSSAAINSEHVNHPIAETYSSTNTNKVVETTNIPQGLSVSHPIDEARYNLATRIMSNGVEVIIAGDKSKLDEGNLLETNSLHQNSIVTQKPMTFPPSTIKNQMIIMLLSSSTAVQQNLSSELQSKTINFTMLPDTDHFFTKTCLTTYTYRVTYLRDSKTIVESKEKVISNIATEDRHYPKITHGLSMRVTLTRTPELAVGIFPTTYSYYNTILDYNDYPVIMTSTRTVINTVTAPDDYIAYLQPIESATPILETNTYYTKLLFTVENDNGATLNTMPNILTQVIITRSLPPAHITSVLTSYYYFTGNEKITSASEYIETQPSFSLTEVEPPAKIEETAFDDVQFYSTSTYISTLTYYITSNVISSVNLMEFSQVDGIRPNYQTHVAQNIVTKRIPHTLIHSDLRSKFRMDLRRKNNNTGILVAMATLENGEILKVTAIDMMKNTLTSSVTSVLPEAVVSSKNITNEYDPVKANPHFNKKANETKLLYTNQKHNYTESQILKHKEPKTPEHSSTNQLFERLTVLKPMFNAVAGLFQNNFVIPNRTQPTKITQNANAPQKNFSNSNTAGKIMNETSHPLYIPMLGSQNNGLKSNIENAIDHIPQSLHIKPPAPIPLTLHFNNSNNWLISSLPDKKKVLWSGAKLQTPLQNGGIPIRPGEIITANSDVIVGKPNGIEPQIPLSRLMNPQNLTNKQYKATLLKSPFEKTRYSDKIFTSGIKLMPPIPINKVSNRESLKNTSMVLYKQRKRIENFDKNILKPPPLSSRISHSSLPLPIPSQVVTKANNYASNNLSNNPFLPNNAFDPPLRSEVPTRNSLSAIATKKNNYSTVKDLERIQDLQMKFFEQPNVSKNRQQVNLDQNVLSHNVNVHVPPLTFNWDYDYPQRASSIKGQILKGQQLLVEAPSSKVFMPLIKIPIDRQEIQVDLTPLKILRTISPSVATPQTNMTNNYSPYILLPTSTSTAENSKFGLNETNSQFLHADKKMYFINTNDQIPLRQKVSDLLLTKGPLKDQIRLQSQLTMQAKKDLTLRTNDSLEYPTEILYQQKGSDLQEKLNDKINYQDDEFRSQGGQNRWIRVPPTAQIGKQTIPTEIYIKGVSNLSTIGNETQHLWVKESNESSLNKPENTQTYTSSLPTNQQTKYRANPILPATGNRSTSTASYYEVLLPKTKEVFLSTPREEIEFQPKQTVPVTTSFAQHAISDILKFEGYDNRDPSESRLNSAVTRESLWEAGPQLSQIKQTLKSLVARNWSISKTNAKYTNLSTDSVKKTKTDMDAYVRLRSSTPDFELLHDIYSLNTKIPESMENLVLATRKTFVPRKRYSTLQKVAISSKTPELGSIPLTYFKITPTTHGLNKKLKLVSQFSHGVIASGSGLKSENESNHSQLNAFKLLHSLESSETYFPISLTASFWSTTIMTTPTAVLKTVGSAREFVTNETYPTEATAATAVITPTETVKSKVIEATSKISTVTMRITHAQVATFMDSITHPKTSHLATVTTTQLTTARTLQTQPILTTSSVHTFDPHFSLILESVTIQEYEYHQQNSNVTEVNNIPHLESRPQITYQQKPYPSVEIAVPDSSFELGKSFDFRKHQRTSSADLGPDSIFIIMTNDKKNSVLTSHELKNRNTDLTVGDDENDDRNSNGILIDYDYNLSFDLPESDKNFSVNGDASVNNIRLEDVFIEPPLQSTIKKYINFRNYTFSSDTTSHLQNDNNMPSSTCQPACKPTRNEYCSFVDYSWRCSCRPGFARVFRDHLCKPTFTYALSIQALQIRSYPLYEKDFIDNATDHFKYLVYTLYDAFDRLIMQSDFRDIYNGIQLANLSLNKIPENKESKLAHDGLTANFVLQLSDNSNEKRLQDVFKKQLRLNNYSIGGTDICTSKSGAESLVVMDFDECVNNKFHDCSSNAHCFNLEGTYTCSCREGFIDLSKNNVYPGRLCSAEIIGCAQCHYHGKCTLDGLKSKSYMCECFPWYTGTKCGVNLKIFLIGFIAAGSFLFILLLFCALLTHIRRKKVCALDSSIMTSTAIPDTPDFNRNKETQSTFLHYTGKNCNSSSNSAHGIFSSNVSGTVPTPKWHRKRIKLEKRAIIKDSSSESSENSLICAFRTRGTLADFKKLLKSHVDGGAEKKLNSFINTGTFLEQQKHRDAHVLVDSSLVMSATATHNNKNFSISDQNFPNLRSAYDLSHPNENFQNEIGAESLHECHYGEESDRSLTVMIPRAKYYPPALQQTLLQTQLAMEPTSNLQHEGSTQNVDDILFKINKHANMKNTGGDIGIGVHIMPGSLVSAGYEVSAIVKGNNSNYIEQNQNLTASEDIKQELSHSTRAGRVYNDNFHCDTKSSAETLSYGESTKQLSTKPRLSKDQNDQINDVKNLIGIELRASL
uniref:EGF-like domain-containing protein n=1 Tax=Glossina brevipalpis TaxID=37001 RepID=A0A1A9WQ99_9MUSC